MGTFKNSMRNRARPVGSIAEAYVATDTLTFCSRYTEDVDNRFNRDTHGTSGDGPVGDDIFVFMHGVKLMGGSSVDHASDEDLEKLVWYMLNHCDAVYPYVE